MERGTIYPSWRYHADGRSLLCLTAAQDDELGSEWSDKDIRGSHNDVAIPELTQEPADTPDEPETPDAPKKRGRPKKA